jgi:hypothetical protein
LTFFDVVKPCAAGGDEPAFGAFQRTITVPYKVDPNQVSADFKDGVLRVTLPKPPDAIAQKEGQKIEVNKSAGGFGGGPTPA